MTRQMIVILISLLLGIALHAESDDKAFGGFDLSDFDSWNGSFRDPAAKETKKKTKKKSKKIKKNKKSRSRSRSTRTNESSNRKSKYESSWEDDFDLDRQFIPEDTDPEWKVSSYQMSGRGGKTIVRLRPLVGINTFTMTGADDANGQNGLTGEDSFGGGDPDYDNIVTPSGGLGVEVGLAQYVSIDTGVSFFQSGSEAKDRGLGWGVWGYYVDPYVEHDRKDKLSLTYLGVPILAKFSVMGVRDGGFYMKIGLMPAFLLDAELERKDVDDSSGTWDAKDQIQGFDLFASAGLGWDLFVSRSVAIIFAGDIHAGLLDVVKDARGEQRNLGGSFSLGLGIQL